MQDESIPTDVAEQHSPEEAKSSKVVHYFVEIGGDLLAKPGALCDLIEAEGGKPVIVFCNTPSDADFVEVLLKKRGVKVRKLIGHVSQSKVAATVEQIRNEEVSVLVVTDIAAQGVKLKDFGLVIVHSTHSDPEVYLERTGQTGDGEAGPSKVISLVGPLDITHFHYLKKIVGLPMEKIDLPDQAKIAQARISRIRQDAMKRDVLHDEKIGPLVSLIVDNEDRDQIIAYLLQNTLEVLPVLSQPTEPRDAEESRDRDRDRDRDSRDSRGGRGGRGDKGGRGDRGDRGDRDRDRDRDRGGRRGQDRKWQGRDEEEDEGAPVRNESHRREPRPYTPPKRELRLYVGHGTHHGFSKEKFIELLQKNSSTPAEEIKRFSERKFYSFVDLSEDFADSTVESLDGIALDDGNAFFIRKAIQIPVPREEGPSQEASGADDEGEAPIVSQETGDEGFEAMEEQGEEA